MIKCEVIENFTLKDFNKLTNLIRATSKNKEGELYAKDTFECDEEMAKYLTGENSKKKVVVKVLEVIPKEIKLTHGDIIEENVTPLDEEKMEKVVEEINNHVEIKKEEKPKKKRTSKKKKGE